MTSRRPLVLVSGVPQELPSTDDILAGVAWDAWSTSFTGFTIGNGTQIGFYKLLPGKTVVCRLHVTLGSTSAVTGDIAFVLPLDRTANYGGANLSGLGRCRFYDLSADAAFDGDVHNTSTVKVSLRVNSVGGAYSQAAATSSTVPFTWAVGDVFTAHFIYEAA